MPTEPGQPPRPLPCPPPSPPASRTPDAREKLQLIDDIFAALAHATRRHVLLAVRFRGGTMSAGDIAARFSCTWPTVTRHLRILVKAGLLSIEKKGRNRIYHLRNDRMSLAREWLDWFETNDR